MSLSCMLAVLLLLLCQADAASGAVKMNRPSQEPLEWIDAQPVDTAESPNSGDVADVLRGGPAKPDLTKVGGAALAAFATVAVLDVCGHVAERWIEDPLKQEMVDHYLDGTAAFLCLVISFLWYGTIQEFIMTQEYSTGFFPSAAFLVLSNRVFSVGFSLIFMIAMGEHLNWAGGRSSCIPGLLNCVASWTEETALFYITFPVVSVFKSSKIVPTMGVNTLVNGEHHSWRDYMIAVFISVCVAGFSLCSRSDTSAPKPGMALGITMMSIGLIIDAYVSCAQKKIFSEHNGFSNMQMMFVMGIYTALLAFFILQQEVGIGPMFVFIDNNPECLKHIVALGCSSTVGTYFIFYIINHQGPVVLAIMMVCRQVVGIILSASLYGHPLTLGAKSFAAFTFAGVLARPLLTLLAGVDPKTSHTGAEPILRKFFAVTRLLSSGGSDATGGRLRTAAARARLNCSERKAIQEERVAAESNAPPHGATYGAVQNDNEAVLPRGSEDQA